MNRTKRLLTSAVAAAFVGIQSFADNDLTMIVGTYTEQSTSEGMYIYRFNQDNGKAEAISSVKAGNPSFLTFNDDATRVYAVNEYDDERRGAGAYSFDAQKGTLSLLSSQHCGTLSNGHVKNMPGAAPCNIMAYGSHLVTSNYNGGDISVFPIKQDGSIGAENQYFCMYKTEGVESHIHCCMMTPDHRYMIATDLGNDCIWRFDANDANKADGTFLTNPTEIYSAPKGTGPRHIVFNDKGTVAYLIGELDGTVTVLGYNDGNLKELQRVQASKTKTSGSADIHLSPDGKFLYASHRLKDEGISIFSVDQNTGLITKIGFQPTAAHPRNFAITPNGNYMLVACRDSNVIEVYRRDKKTGKLVNTRQNIKLGKPVCIQFASL